MSLFRLPLTLTLAALVASPAVASNDALSEIKVPPFYTQRDRGVLERTISEEKDPKEVAIAWFGLAGLGVEGAAHEAVDQFSTLPSIEADPMMQAYLGSAYIMKARDQSFVPARVISVRRGLQWLEGAIEAAPNEFEIRAMRAGTTLNLPDIFGYQATTRSDLELLIQRIEAGGAPIPRGSQREGRMIAALGKICAELDDITCAQSQIKILRDDYADHVELVNLAKQISAAMPK